MNYDRQQWANIRDRMHRLMDNEARLFPDQELAEWEHLLAHPDPRAVRQTVEIRLQNSPLRGELLEQFTRSFDDLIGGPLQTRSKDRILQPEISAWVTVRDTHGQGERI